jgi:hypothetical protein
LEEITKEAHLMARLHHVERRVESHDLQIGRLNQIAEKAEETGAINKDMLESIHNRMDKQDAEQLRLSDVEKVVRDQVPALITVGIEASIGRWATKIILWVVATAGAVIVSNGVEHWPGF